MSFSTEIAAVQQDMGGLVFAGQELLIVADDPQLALRPQRMIFRHEIHPPRRDKHFGLTDVTVHGFVLL